MTRSRIDPRPSGTFAIPRAESSTKCRFVGTGRCESGPPYPLSTRLFCELERFNPVPFWNGNCTTFLLPRSESFKAESSFQPCDAGSTRPLGIRKLWRFNPPPKGLGEQFRVWNCSPIPPFRPAAFGGKIRGWSSGRSESVFKPACRSKMLRSRGPRKRHPTPPGRSLPNRPPHPF